MYRDVLENAGTILEGLKKNWGPLIMVLILWAVYIVSYSIIDIL